jgi:glycerol-3-phosphate dehydrogenase (NAD(P)+)
VRHIGVLGSGAWGTALAIVAARGGPVTLWSRNPVQADAINSSARNDAYLPGIELPTGLTATAELAAVMACDALIAAVPAQALCPVLARAGVGGRPLLLAAKGVEQGTLRLPHEVACAACPEARVSAVSGPSFAAEVAAGLPTAVVIAGEHASDWAARLSGPAFRPYASDDLVGVEVGGAAKNVLAIGCGAVIGAGLGENARAALIARGLAEIGRYAEARGGRAETIAGLAGLGDAVLSCVSEASRNYRYGLALGRGERGGAGQGTLIEGAATAPALAADARARGVEMPVAQAVAALVSGERLIDEVMAQLLARPLRREG